MRILLMGGTRFIGVYLTKVLVAQGHEVVLFNRGNKPAPVAGVSQIHGDRKDPSQLKEKLAGESFEIVIILGTINISRTNRSPRYTRFS